MVICGRNVQELGFNDVVGTFAYWLGGWTYTALTILFFTHSERFGWYAIYQHDIDNMSYSIGVW